MYYNSAIHIRHEELEMKKNLGITLLLLGIVLFFTQGEFANHVLCFLLTGSIIGTSFALPFWMMMAIYCALIALIATDRIEDLVIRRRTIRAERLRANRMPRRRYSSL